jgi:hypothetical protein
VSEGGTRFFGCANADPFTAACVIGTSSELGPSSGHVLAGALLLVVHVRGTPSSGDPWGRPFSHSYCLWTPAGAAFAPAHQEASPYNRDGPSPREHGLVPLQRCSRRCLLRIATRLFGGSASRMPQRIAYESELCCRSDPHGPLRQESGSPPTHQLRPLHIGAEPSLDTSDMPCVRSCRLECRSTHSYHKRIRSSDSAPFPSARRGRPNTSGAVFVPSPVGPAFFFDSYCASLNQVVHGMADNGIPNDRCPPTTHVPPDRRPWAGRQSRNLPPSWDAPTVGASGLPAGVGRCLAHPPPCPLPRPPSARRQDSPRVSERKRGRPPGSRAGAEGQAPLDPAGPFACGAVRLPARISPQGLRPPRSRVRRDASLVGSQRAAGL